METNNNLNFRHIILKKKIYIYKKIIVCTLLLFLFQGKHNCLQWVTQMMNTTEKSETSLKVKEMTRTPELDDEKIEEGMTGWTGNINITFCKNKKREIKITPIL